MDLIGTKREHNYKISTGLKTLDLLPCVGMKCFTLSNDGAIAIVRDMP